MSGNRKPLSYYKEAVKALRPYTRGFTAADGYDLRKAGNWSNARKGAISRYFEILRSAQGTPHYVYRPRKKENLKILLKSRGMEGHKRFTAAFIPVPLTENKHGDLVPQKPIIRITKDKKIKIKLKKFNYTREYILPENYNISYKDFINDPEIYVSDLIDQLDYKHFTIITGEHEYTRGSGIPTFLAYDQVVPELKRLLERYGSDRHDPNDKNSSYYGNWFFGLVGYRFEKQGDQKRIRDDLRAYLSDKAKRKKKINDLYNKIRRLNKSKDKIKRHKRLTPYITNIVNRDITQLMKTASPEEKDTLQGVRNYMRHNKNKVIPQNLREFLNTIREDKIKTIKSEITNLKKEQLLINKKRNFEK